MNWFKDMLMLFSEWVLLMIIPLLLGILIGWILWYKKWKSAQGEYEKLLKELKSKLLEKNKLLSLVSDDLSAIKGIDENIETQLKSKGINSYYDLAILNNYKVDLLENEFKFEGDRIRNENWVPQAAQLHFEKHGEEIYDKVNVAAVYKDEFEKQLAEANKGMVFDYKDDLKLISGVGPKMEGLLHDFGITTFYHLSMLNIDGVNALNDKLEFFPGRIERDDWIGQAKDLHKRMHK